jgi:hypothetical protein
MAFDLALLTIASFKGGSVQNQGLDQKRSLCFLAFDTELTTGLHQGSATHGK